MFNKGTWKYVLIACGWLIALGGVVVLMSFISEKKAAVICKAVRVYIPGNQYFIDKQEIDNIVNEKALVGRNLESINIHSLEISLKANPFVQSAKVFEDMDGEIEVEIIQRQPILRILNQNNQDYYVDENGLKIPLSQNFTAMVLVANGFIEEPFGGQVDTLHTALAKAVYKTADYIRKDSLWAAQIAEIYVNQQHEIELIPRVGNQRILLGDADSLDNKFSNLYIFYKKALPQAGWGTYKAINIKYANQVIGVRNQLTKKDSLAAKAKKDSVQMVKDTSQISN
jgi:cell division protein FtsQ